MLISDQVLFGNLDNLDVNVDDPFRKFVPPNGLLSTVNSGQRYNMAYRHKVKDPSKDFMMPIIFACDKTHLQKGEKAASWPLLFTTSILNQKARNLPIAWRTLGYINDLSLIQSSAHDKNLSKELKAERLHAIFKTLLAFCPIEPLHSLENGIIPDCLTILFKNEMHPALKAELDGLVRRLRLLLGQRFANSGM
jgi:hypothetical protein